MSPVASALYRIEQRPVVDGLEIALRGRIDLDTAEPILRELSGALPGDGKRLHLDLSGVDYFDSGGGAVLLRLRDEADRQGSELHIAASTPAIDGFLSLIDHADHRPPHESVDEKALFVKLGEGTLRFLADTREMIIFTGELILGLAAALRHPRQIRWRETWLYMERTGVDGVPIVVLISFLMGLITAFQAAIQLSQFGADIYIANLVGLSITRELGPLMTAIIAAGRSGAAFAAEIGTMKVSEEVDALTTMGFDRTRFLVVPKVLALVLMLPCLVLLADFVGILGGLVVAMGILGLPAQVYLRQMQWVLTTWDVFSGLLKTIAFAILIAGVACLRGFQARGGAESVGRITTSAIVAAIFLIILADAVFTVVFHYW